jgi:hypothetical protein
MPEGARWRVQAHPFELELSPSTLNLRLPPLSKVPREMADNDLLDPAAASAIERTKAVKREGSGQGTGCSKNRQTRF